MPRRKILFGEEARILVALLEYGKNDITSLVRITGFSRQAVTNNVNLLKAYGLVEDEYERYPPNRRFVYLTEKGKKIATLLKQVLEEIGEELPKAQTP